jgi:exopolyphosphatase/guanosine-5'-triphosphate,3'-diphosphate pyrophosphatase
MPVNAIIDVGTNSIKLLVADCTGGNMSVLLDRNEITRLGEGYEQSGELEGAAMSRSLEAIAEMAGAARALGAHEIAAVGTQALRGSRNSPDFIKSVKSACGVSIVVIDGDEEARLSYAAAAGFLSRLDRLGRPALEGGVLVFDIGGGSSEIISGDGPEIKRCCSMRFGALSLHRRFFENAPDPVPADTMERACGCVRSMLGGDADASGIKEDGVWAEQCAGTGGTITTLAAVMLELDPYDPSAVTGSRIETGELERQIELYSSMMTKDRVKIKGLDPKRADIILAGACIANELMRFFGAKAITVSDHGLRYGAMEKFFRR